MSHVSLIVLLISAAASYLSGGINGAIIMSGLVYHEDIRTKGSGNPGFTNFKRVYGLHAVTWSVMLLDILKTALPILITGLLLQSLDGMWQLGCAWSGLFCMLGHCFPVWYQFRGGKAFIAGFASIWFVDPLVGLISLSLFLLTLFTIRIMSISSCLALFIYPIMLAVLGHADADVIALSGLAALLVIVRHYPNFVKLIHGQESRFHLRNK